MLFLNQLLKFLYNQGIFHTVFERVPVAISSVRFVLIFLITGELIDSYHYSGCITDSFIGYI